MSSSTIDLVSDDPMAEDGAHKDNDLALKTSLPNILQLTSLLDLSSEAFEPSTSPTSIRSSDPIGSSPLEAYDHVKEDEGDITAKAVLRLQVSGHKDLALEVLRGLSFRQEGWCKSVQLKPSKGMGIYSSRFGE